MTAIIITVLLILLSIIIKKLPTADTTNLWLFKKICCFLFILLYLCFALSVCTIS